MAFGRMASQRWAHGSLPFGWGKDEVTISLWWMHVQLPHHVIPCPGNTWTSFPNPTKASWNSAGIGTHFGDTPVVFLIVHVNILASNQPNHTVAKGFQEIAQTQHEDGRWAGLITVFMLNHILNPLSFGIEIIYTCFPINDFSWTYFI